MDPDLVHPLQLLPPEMWEKILRYLETDPRDVINASEACVLFENLLWDQSRACQLEEILPMTFKCLHLEDVLKCRLICKRIRNGVDHILDHVPVFSKYQTPNLIKVRHRPPHQPARSFEWTLSHKLKWGVWVTLNTADKLDNFQKEMQTSLQSPRGRPFIGKHLELGIDPDGEEWMDRDFLEKGIGMMSHFQTKLTHVYFDPWELGMEMIETYETVRRILQAVPNLQSFRGHIDDSWEWNDQLAADLHQHIEMNPLPLMPFLKRITFEEFELAHYFYEQIASKYGGHLEVLKLKFMVDFYEGHFEHPEYLVDDVHQFPALIEMSLSLTWRMRNLLLNMQTASLVSLKLKLFRTEAAMQLTDFVRIFSGFPNLAVLHLRLGFRLENDIVTVDEDFFEDERNRHPSLKKLTLWGDYFLPLSLQFCVDLFPNLEVFIVHTSAVNLSTNSDPDFHLLRNGRMYESGLWERSPSLQCIRRYLSLIFYIENGVFTRDGYQKYLQERV